MSQISDIATVELHCKDQNVKDTFNELSKTAVECQKQMRAAAESGDKVSYDKWRRELKHTRSQINAIVNECKSVELVMQDINSYSMKDLQDTLKRLEKQIKNEVHGTEEWAAKAEDIKKLKERIAEINNELRVSETTLQRVKRFFNEWTGYLVAGAGALAGVVAAGKSAVSSYAEIEQEMANVRKFTGLSAEEVERLNEELKKIDTRTSRIGLNQLAQEAGRLGKQSVEDVMGFVRAADVINVALDDLGEGATLQLSKLTQIFGDEQRLGTEKALLSVGSVVNELSQNCAASAPYIAEFASRLGGVAAQAGMTSQQIMGIAAVMDAKGQKLEASATSVAQVITRMYQEPAKYAAAAGLEVTKFTELLRRDANEALLVLAETLNAKGGLKDTAPIFADMGEKGSRAVAALATLAENIKEVRAQQEAANEAFEEATSVTAEFNVQNSTVQAGLDKAKERFLEISRQLGQKLMPVMKYAISSTSAIMRSLSKTVDFVIEHKTAIIGATSAVAAYTVAANLNTIAVAANKAAHIAASTVMRGIKPIVIATQWAYFALTQQTRKAAITQNALNTAMKLSPWGLLAAGAAAAVTAIVGYVKRVKEAREAEAARVKAAEEHRASLRDIEEESARSAKAELRRAKSLYEATTDENKSRKERLQAVKDLKDAYPDYFSKLDNEIILAGKAQSAYDSLCESIVKSARARAAAAKIEANESAMIDEEIKADKLRKQIDDLQNQLLRQRVIARQTTIEGRDGSKAYTKQALKALAEARRITAEIDSLSQQLGEVESAMWDIDDANRELAEKYGADIAKLPNSGKPASAYVPTAETETEKKRKAREKAEKKAAAERKAQLKKDLDEQKALLEQEEALNLISYLTGEKNYEQYVSKKKAIDMGLIDKQLDVLAEYGEQDSKQYADLLLKRSQLQKKWADEKEQLSLNAIESNYAFEKEKLTSMYVDANSTMFMNDKAFKEAMFNAEVEYLNKKIDLYKDDAKKRASVEKQLNKIVVEDQKNRAKENYDLRKKFEDDYLSGKFKAFDKSLKEIDKLEQKGIITADEATKARLKELSSFLSSQGQEFAGALTSLAEQIFSLTKGLGADFKDVTVASLGVMTAALQQYSAYASAQRDLEIAETEKKYEAEIAAAGGNQSKIEKIEKRKAAETAQIKKKHNDRAMKIEIAQALAQTAMSAIAAYASAAAIPVTGWVLGPVAAALATAAGMMQVATIKKQHDAEAAGYSAGGFTSPGAVNEPAGIVHSGEWVASQKLVNSPVTRPIIDMLEYAQRTNTIGKIAMPAPQSAYASVSAQAASDTSQVIAANAAAMSLMSDVAERLTQKLDEPIAAITSLTGDLGIKQAQDEYDKLMKNKSPKK